MLVFGVWFGLAWVGWDGRGGKGKEKEREEKRREEKGYWVMFLFLFIGDR